MSAQETPEKKRLRLSGSQRIQLWLMIAGELFTVILVIWLIFKK